MHPQSIKARSTPYRDLTANSQTCGRCGITQKARRVEGTYYCIDCRIPAQTLGWATPGPTCSRCPNRVRFATTELCGTCKWTLKRRNTR